MNRCLNPDLEHALIALLNAVDGNGCLVRLHSGEPTSSSLRVTIREFMRVGIDENFVWLGSGLRLSRSAEAAYWRNLALLANATAAAVALEVL